MSMPSASRWVQIGVIISKALPVSLHERPAMDPESSIRKMVSKDLRNAYWSSFSGGPDTSDCANGCIAGCPIGLGVYAGGGSFAGVLKALIPGRSEEFLSFDRLLSIPNVKSYLVDG
jgi:hypothetical protein